LRYICILVESIDINLFGLKIKKILKRRIEKCLMIKNAKNSR